MDIKLHGHESHRQRHHYLKSKNIILTFALHSLPNFLSSKREKKYSFSSFLRKGNLDFQFPFNPPKAANTHTHILSSVHNRTGKLTDTYIHARTHNTHNIYIHVCVYIYVLPSITLPLYQCVYISSTKHIYRLTF